MNAGILLRTAARAAPPCASALADAVWLRTHTARRTFAVAARLRNTEYTAYKLPRGGVPPVPMPRNMDPSVGETSITLDAPRRAAPDAHAQIQTDQHRPQKGYLASQPQSQSQPHTPTPTPPPTQRAPQAPPAEAPSQTQKRPRRALRPLKAALKLTPAAVSQLSALIDDPEPRMIRIGVRNKGCSGLAYHLEYIAEKDIGKLDETVEQDGVRVLVEGRALMSVVGSEMDWVEDRLSARFVFRNPNIKETCGCGESFMV